MSELLKPTPSDLIKVTPPVPVTFNAFLAEIMNREAFGMPVSLIACAVAAVVFGGLLAMTLGSH